MTAAIQEVKDRVYEITLDYADEGVDLQVNRKVGGTEERAAAYVPAFDRDIRANYASLFPIPEYPEEDLEEEMI